MNVLNDGTTLNKQRIIRLVGQRTRLSNRITALIIDEVIRLLTEEIATGRRAEIENFLTLQVQTRTRKRRIGEDDLPGGTVDETIYTLKCRPGKRLRMLMRASFE